MKKNEKNIVKNEQPTARIHALSHDGRGIATVQNKTTFITGALPEETVVYRAAQKHSHYNEALLVDILQPSSARVPPPCLHFGVCGGCSLQYMNMETQLQFKEKTVLDQLMHFGRIQPESVLPPLQASHLGYRRKARLGVKFVFKKNKLLVGFREKSSRYLADLQQCLVLHPAVGQRLLALAELIQSLEQYQTIPQIEVAMGDTDAALVFRHLLPLSDADRRKLVNFGENHQFHLYLQPNPPAKVQKCWPPDSVERLRYTLPEEGLEFLFHPLDFTQINLEMNRLMVRQALDLLALQPEESVLDLFCGIGNFTLPMARHARHVTGVEGGLEMVERAKENAGHNKLANVEFHAANLMEPNPSAPWLKTAYDKILLDPPRVGAKEILPLLPAINAKRIVYVSCNPATLARDAGELVHQYKYCLKTVGIMNMFPHTSHIEAMAVFDRGE